MRLVKPVKSNVSSKLTELHGQEDKILGHGQLLRIILNTPVSNSGSRMAQVPTGEPKQIFRGFSN